MDRNKKAAKVSFDDLAKERLSDEQRDSVEQVELYVQSAPKFLMMLNKGNVFLSINLKYPIKKLLIYLSTLGSLAYGLVQVIANWTIIQSLFIK